MLALAASSLVGGHACGKLSRPHSDTLPLVSRCGRPSMGLFDGLAAAFENDNALGDRDDAGLTRRVQLQTITWQGPPPEGMAALFEKAEVKEQQAMPGKPIKDLAQDAGIPLRYSCMRGTCGICDVKVNGVETPACKATMPNVPCTIEYKGSAQATQYMKEKMKAQAAAKKAARAAGTPPVGAVGRVQPTKAGRTPPTNPFGGNPFGGSPFGSGEKLAPQRELSPLEQQLAAENAAKKAKKGGWPFG